MKLFLDDTREFPKWGYECCRDSKTAIILLSIQIYDQLYLQCEFGNNVG